MKGKQELYLCMVCGEKFFLRTLKKHIKKEYLHKKTDIILSSFLHLIANIMKIKWDLCRSKFGSVLQYTALNLRFCVKIFV